MSNILKKVYQSESGDRIFEVWHGNIKITVHRRVDPTWDDIIDVYDYANDKAITTQTIRKPHERERIE